ncbi:MAG: PAS domain-containing protein [Nitrosopumilus sp.]|jgi:PAS domain S-box-containing protein|nr:PAS domain-containing protein [Nitrosopumilus sp.]MBT3956447.1 PAS domain-containing protein [Nitrosopumilus sp.]MBT4535909.1 PAS domain-containing protein [Nitrosopumilus sp.]MBT6083319.1 PAS domain-containing protein [Nitrosopumilus sp.]MBT6397190.1 PAS domain-containing protein [Nitrosopumilus sp.]
MYQTEARKILKDAPIMWRRINSIGMILDCNSTYALNLGYAKSEILGKPIFEHVPKESWESMNNSLKTWFETGKVTDRKITFSRQDKTTFTGLLQATSLYDENKDLIGSNTVIFNLTQMSDENIKKYEEFFTESNKRLEEIKEKEYDKLDKNSKSEYDGLKEMFQMLSEIDLKKIN